MARTVLNDSDFQTTLSTMHLSKHTQWAPPQNCWSAKSWVWLGSLCFKQNLTHPGNTFGELLISWKRRKGWKISTFIRFLSLESPIFYKFVELIADFSPQAHTDFQSYSRERMHNLIHRLFYFKTLFSYYCVRYFCVNESHSIKLSLSVWLHSAWIWGEFHGNMTYSLS